MWSVPGARLPAALALAQQFATGRLGAFYASAVYLLDCLQGTQGDLPLLALPSGRVARTPRQDARRAHISIRGAALGAPAADSIAADTAVVSEEALQLNRLLSLSSPCIFSLLSRKSPWRPTTSTPPSEQRLPSHSLPVRAQQRGLATADPPAAGPAAVARRRRLRRGLGRGVCTARAGAPAAHGRAERRKRCWPASVVTSSSSSVASPARVCRVGTVPALQTTAGNVTMNIVL